MIGHFGAGHTNLTSFGIWPVGHMNSGACLKTLVANTFTRGGGIRSTEDTNWTKQQLNTQPQFRYSEFYCFGTSLYKVCTTWDGYLCSFILLVATCMSFALIFMCCSAGCYCNVHVQVALHVQVHVLVVCRCSAWSAAYVIRVQLPGISWNLYDCKVSFTVFFLFFFLFFLCDIVFAPLVFCAPLFFSPFFSLPNVYFFWEYFESPCGLLAVFCRWSLFWRWVWRWIVVDYRVVFMTLYGS